MHQVINDTATTTLGSILRAAPVSPSRRVLAALALNPAYEPPTLAELHRRMGGSQTHMLLVLNERRDGSDDLWQRVADFVGLGLTPQDLRGQAPLVVEGGSAPEVPAGCSALSS